MSIPVLTAVAWPYTNGPRHIGHVPGTGVPSDLRILTEDLRGRAAISEAIPHSAQQVHELLGGTGTWAAQPEVHEVDDLDIAGVSYPILTGDYAAEQARWASTPIEVGRPLDKPTPLFAKIDPKLAETGPQWAPIAP